MTGTEVKTLIASHSEIDAERIHVLETLGNVSVEIDACTEDEQRKAQSILHQYVPATIKWDVQRREVPEKPPAYDLEKLRTIVSGLGDAPDTQLDKAFTKRIRDGLPTELEAMLKFIRNLRDECVFGGAASGFVMTLLNCLLEDYPEPAGVMAERRAELEAKYGM